MQLILKLIRHFLSLHTVKAALFTASLITILLFIWRTLYQWTDWAVLALIPLIILLFMGSAQTRLAVYQANMKVVIRENSKLSWLKKAKVWTWVTAMFFSLVLVLLLAFHAFSSSWLEFLSTAFLCFFAALFFAYVKCILLNYLTPSFAQSTAISFATIIVGVAFVVLYVFGNLIFWEASELGDIQLPEREGWIANSLTPLYMFESAKRWFALLPEQSGWITMLRDLFFKDGIEKIVSTTQHIPQKWRYIMYSLDTALISFIIANASAVLMSLMQTIIKQES